MPSIQLSDRYRRPAVFAVAGILVVALVALTLAWPNSSPDSATGSPSPTGSAGQSSGPTTGGIDVAELTAIDAAGPVVALDGRFRLASLGNTPASELVGRIRVEPALDLAVEPQADGRTVVLTPREPLVPGAVYRFTLRGASNEELDSWAFQAKQSLRVVGTLPSDQQTEVPLDTGIEVTFDQDGVTDAASHVTIEPATKGRFELHGRVLAFVPEALVPATLYTVTVSRGVTVEATGESLVDDVRFRFETAAKAEPAGGAMTFQFQDDVVESATASAPVVGLWGFGGDETKPKSARLEVYRLPGLDAAVTAFRQLRAFPRWSRWSSDGLVATAGLPKVLAINAKLNDYRGSLWVSLPDPLPAGWYLVQVPTGTRPVQAVLQVTDVAGYTAVSTTRTLVWANDLATGGPITGATVATSDGDLGRTDAQGLLMADTPASFPPGAAAACKDPCEPVLTVTTSDGREAFLPGSSQQYGPQRFDDSWYWWWEDADPRYWVLLNTDRTLYRPTDATNVWGVVRDRESGDVPATVKLRLAPQTPDGGGRAPISSLTIKPGPTGAFTGSFALSDLPEGPYDIELVVGGDVVRTMQVQVAPILKPAYRLEVVTGRRIYIAGDQVRVTVRASFFEGTPVPGVPLRLDGVVERNVTTDETGTAIHRTVATTDVTSYADYQTVGVSPARAEEGEIGGASRDFLVFPCSRTVDATSEISGGRVRVKGSVHLVDVDRLEREVGGGGSIWDLDPRGKPVAATNVIVKFVELIPTKTRTGTEYDFIAKKAIPVYTYDTVYRERGTVTVKTNGSGDYAASVPASGARHDYQVELTISDPDGNHATTNTYASAKTLTNEEVEDGGLRLTDPASHPDGFAIGDSIDVTMSVPGATSAAAKAGKYLFFVAQRGLREATVESDPRYVTNFEAWAAPNLDIGAIKFTGATYVDGGRFRADFRETDRHLAVDLAVSSPRYAPGDNVTVDVTTRNAKGAPVASTVILRAVDEKLFSIGGAEEVDSLSMLYRAVDSGVYSTYQSHRSPRGTPDGGDTTGGGGDDRQDFRDSLLFKTVDTGADGRGSVSFKLSDDLTSWRVSASAISVDLEAGDSSIAIPVGLPFFVDAAVAPEYLVADHPTIQVRAFGSALQAGSAVTITVASDSLKFSSKPIETTAFATVGVPLPDLSAGTHDLTISATSRNGTASLTDRLTRRFVVIPSRLTVTRTAHVELGRDVRLDGGDGLTTAVLSDAGAGRHLPLLVELASGGGARLDRSLAADLAGAILTRRFGSTEGGQPIDPFMSDRYQTPDGGLALLPYASSDLELSALVAIVAPERVETLRLESYLTNVREAVTETRERRMFALAGLAGLGAPVLPDIQAAAADPELTVRERLMIGIGAAYLGDASTARSIAAALIREHGEALGETARLRVGSTAADVTSATALMAVLAAAVGDSRAAAYWAYVEGNPGVDELHVLHAVAYIERTLDRLAVQPASFAYTLDGVRQAVDLDPGESFALTLTAAQRASMTLEAVTGAVGITTSWREPVSASAFEPDPDVRIKRSVRPAGTIGTDDLVRVDLTVTFGPKAAKGCHQVIDLLPSGLVAVGSLAAWIDPAVEEPAQPADVSLPYAQTGQRAFFCAEPYAKTRVANLRYYARVVTPGTYAWEPAVLESRTGENRAAITPLVTITIR